MVGTAKGPGLSRGPLPVCVVKEREKWEVPLVWVRVYSIGETWRFYVSQVNFLLTSHPIERGKIDSKRPRFLTRGLLPVCVVKEREKWEIFFESLVTSKKYQTFTSKP